VSEQLRTPSAKCLGGVGGPTSWAPYARDWWVGCPEGGPFAASQTTLLDFEQLGVQPCNVTVVYVSHVASGIYGLGTMTTRQKELAPGLEAFELGLANLCSPLPVGSLNRARVDAFITGPRAQGLPALQSLQASAMVSLRQVLRWVGGSADVLAGLLGASRRSIYNWLNGKPIRDEFATRTTRLAMVLAPLGEQWHPEALAHWLTEGSPTHVELAQHDCWVELGEEVRRALTPLSPKPEDEPLDSHSVAPESLPAATLMAALEAFSSPPPTPARSPDDWQPRELTGITPGPDEG
jgi:hypothetical protein